MTLESNGPRKMGPLGSMHPMVRDEMVCPGCDRKFREGQYVTLVQIGPGDDTDARAKAIAGRPYNAVAIPAHWSCVTGEVA